MSGEMNGGLGEGEGEREGEGEGEPSQFRWKFAGEVDVLALRACARPHAAGVHIRKNKGDHQCVCVVVGGR